MAPILRALVVDDDPDTAELFAMFLRRLGYQVVTVFSAQEALAAARAERFDLILSDIGMPGMNGYELAEALRRMPEYRKAPMVAITGYSLYDDRQRAIQAGFNQHLTKPVDPQMFATIIKRLGHR